MRDTKTLLFVHLVWGTWDRLPLINSANQEAIYSTILTECNERDVRVLAIGGIFDHIHMLVKFPPTIAISYLVKQLKGSSSHLVNHCNKDDGFFKWQGSYGAFTVAEKDLGDITRYIIHQPEHHKTGSIMPYFELE